MIRFATVVVAPTANLGVVQATGDQRLTCYFGALAFAAVASGGQGVPAPGDRVAVARGHRGLVALYYLGKGAPTRVRPV